MKIESIPGLFVSWEDELSGTCLDNVVVQYPNLVDASRPELMTHINNVYGNKNSNKNSPAKSPKNGNEYCFVFLHMHVSSHMFENWIYSQ